MPEKKKFDREFLLSCATEVVNWIALQDPMFEERIQITKDEYHLDDLQIVANYMARTLDLGEHMFYCEREFMRPGYSGHLGPRACIVCDKEFAPGLATDEVCHQQDCLAAYNALRDKTFEAKI